MSEAGILETSKQRFPLDLDDHQLLQCSTRLLNSTPQRSDPASQLESALLGHPVTSCHSQARDSSRPSAGDSVGPGREAFPGLLALVTWRG